MGKYEDEVRERNHRVAEQRQKDISGAAGVIGWIIVVLTVGTIAGCFRLF